jgi:squalene synthase HpnC
MSNNDFANELKRFGPARRWRPMTLAMGQRYCTRLALTHYENFSVASLLLPRRLLRHFHAVYAYCRWADDLGDETGGGRHALELLAWWRGQLMLCYQGRPSHPVMVALQHTIRRFRVPPEPFLNLILAFEQDQVVKRYETYTQVLDYCRNSANPVGHLVLYLCESYDAERAKLADCICTGLQLANFWQDVARDLDIGRVYLPAEDRRRFGYSDDELDVRRFTSAFADLMRYEVDRTRALLYQGLPLVGLMPVEMRSDIELFIGGGLAILRKIEKRRYNVWKRRPALGKRDKAALLARAFWRRIMAGLF